MSDGGRPWQNWDVGDTSARIDEYWVSSSLELENRIALTKGIAESFGTGAQIFEVGCGSGMIGQELINQGVTTSDRYSGGDISKTMLEIARKRLPECHLIDLDIFNLAALPQRDNVICLHVLQHLPHYQDALSQLIRFAKKQLYVATWFSDSGADELSMGKDGPGEPIFNTNRYGLDGFLNAIRDAGRPIVKISERQVVLHTRAVHVAFA